MEIFVLLHGLGGTGAYWTTPFGEGMQAFVGALNRPDIGRKIVAPTFGHAHLRPVVTWHRANWGAWIDGGGSWPEVVFRVDTDEPNDIEAYAAEGIRDFARDVMTQVDDEVGSETSFHLVGHSLGALVAAYIASERKPAMLGPTPWGARVKSLTLISGYVKADTMISWDQRLTRELYRHDNSCGLAMRRFIGLSSTSFLDQQPGGSDFWEWVLSTMRQGNNDWARAIRHSLVAAGVDLTDRVSHIIVPTLVAYGGDDLYGRVGDSQFPARFTRRSYPDVGHMVPQECGQDLVSRVLDNAGLLVPT